MPKLINLVKVIVESSHNVWHFFRICKRMQDVVVVVVVVVVVRIIISAR